MGFGLHDSTSWQTIIIAQTCGCNGVSGTKYLSGVLDFISPYDLKMVRDGVDKTWTYSYKQASASTWTELAVVNDSKLPGGGPPGWMIGPYAKSWLTGSGTPSADFDYFRVSDVPEPGALALLGCGLASLLAYAWCKLK